MPRIDHLRPPGITQCPWARTVGRSLVRRFRIDFARLVVVAALSVVGVFGQASSGQSGTVDLTQASLEDLMNIQVTSVSKKEQKLAKTGAAIFVITQDDIHRSGATNIPDVLRMAPGVDVAQIDANRWAISIRGFNAVYSNKVLVLIDGRSVYLDSFSGVFWDQMDVLLEDIERIEVIRGPGGTVWGANAVNGVINIITKDSRKTHGGLVSGGGGSVTAADSTVQYGGGIGSTGSYRVFAHTFDIDNFTTPGGRPATDGWHGSHGGFRTDWDLSRRDTLSVQGDVAQTAGGENVKAVFPSVPLQTNLNESVTNRAGDMMARWEHNLSGGSQTSLQISYSYVNRFGDGGVDQYYRTADVEFEHHLSIGARHDIVWGLSYRFDNTDLQAPLGYSHMFSPNSRNDSLAAVFLQDEIAITKSFSLTVGSKFEHNAYTGFEYEPGVQAVWSPTNRHALWASASRAIRQPALLDLAPEIAYSVVPLGGSFGVVTVFGDPHPKSEELLDFETGYRSQVAKRLSVDLTGFLSYYRNLQTVEPHDPFVGSDSGTPYIVIPELFAFDGHGRDYGVEAFVNWDASSRLKISSGYSFVNMATAPGASSPPSTIMSVPDGDSPRNQFQIRGHLGLRRNLDLDASAAYTSPLADVAGYTRVDLRLGWQLGEHLEFSVVGQNLTSRRHLEFVDSILVNGTEIPRSVFARAQWRF